MLTLLVAHLQFAQTNRTTQKLQKSHQSNATQSEYTKHNEKKGGRITRVTVAQLPFLEILFQKHKILTSLEAILERFIF